MTKPKPESKKGAEAPSFEKSLAELEAIVARMESGRLGLEEMIEHFERGQALVQFCSQRLNEVERKIEVLVKKGGAVAVEPFEPPAEAAAGGPAAEDEESV